MLEPCSRPAGPDATAPLLPSPSGLGACAGFPLPAPPPAVHALEDLGPGTLVPPRLEEVASFMGRAASAGCSLGAWEGGGAGLGAGVAGALRWWLVTAPEIRGAQRAQIAARKWSAAATAGAAAAAADEHVGGAPSVSAAAPAPPNPAASAADAVALGGPVPFVPTTPSFPYVSIEALGAETRADGDRARRVIGAVRAALRASAVGAIRAQAAHIEAAASSSIAGFAEPSVAAELYASVLRELLAAAEAEMRDGLFRGGGGEGGEGGGSGEGGGGEGGEGSSLLGADVRFAAALGRRHQLNESFLRLMAREPEAAGSRAGRSSAGAGAGGAARGAAAADAAAYDDAAEAEHEMWLGEVEEAGERQAFLARRARLVPHLLLAASILVGDAVAFLLPHAILVGAVPAEISAGAGEGPGHLPRHVIERSQILQLIDGVSVLGALTAWRKGALESAEGGGGGGGGGGGRGGGAASAGGTVASLIESALAAFRWARREADSAAAAAAAAAEVEAEGGGEGEGSPLSSWRPLHLQILRARERALEDVLFSIEDLSELIHHLEAAVNAALRGSQPATRRR
jgi:hypothetical protein